MWKDIEVKRIKKLDKKGTIEFEKIGLKNIAELKRKQLKEVV